MTQDLRGLFILPLLLLSAPRAFAAVDFYGVKMTSEYHAKNLVVDESGAAPKFSVDKPGMDKRISATARLSGRQVKIKVFNGSDEVIHSEHDTAETIVVTQDGERIVLKPASMAWSSSDTIGVDKNASFEPSFRGRALKKNEIRAIICSFDLGEVKIILLPLADKISEIKPPVKKEARPAPAVKPPVKKEAQSPAKSRPASDGKPAPKKVEDKTVGNKGSFFGNFFGPKKEAKPAKIKTMTKKETIRSEPIKPADKKLPEKKTNIKPKAVPVKKIVLPKIKEEPPILAPAPSPKKTESAKPKIVAGPLKIEPAADASAKEKKILGQYEKSRKSRKYWHVEEVREGFVVINLGEGDGLKPGASIQIVRDGSFVAQAQVRQVSSSYATVSVPQEAAVITGDDVLFFGATP